MLQDIALRIRPAHLVVGALAALAAIAALATPASRPVPSGQDAIRPTNVRLPITTKIATSVVDDEPAAPSGAVRRQVAQPPVSQTGTSQPAAQAVGSGGGGGDTNVTVDNGTNDSETSSGGSHVGNNADVSATASSSSSDPDEGGP